jgi:hypothetical protein
MKAQKYFRSEVRNVPAEVGKVPPPASGAEGFPGAAEKFPACPVRVRIRGLPEQAIYVRKTTCELLDNGSCGCGC